MDDIFILLWHDLLALGACELTLPTMFQGQVPLHSGWVIMLKGWSTFFACIVVSIKMSSSKMSPHGVPLRVQLTTAILGTQVLTLGGMLCLGVGI